jgi:hypothetical protein
MNMLLNCQRVEFLDINFILDFNFILACVYRSPIGDFDEFLHKLELVICTGQSKGIFFF